MKFLMIPNTVQFSQKYPGEYRIGYVDFYGRWTEWYNRKTCNVGRLGSTLKKWGFRFIGPYDMERG